MPVSNVARATTIMTGAKRSSGGPISISRLATVVASDEVAGARALPAAGNTFERHSSQILQAPAPFYRSSVLSAS
jgi:hypothetical protein